MPVNIQCVNLMLQFFFIESDDDPLFMLVKLKKFVSVVRKTFALIINVGSRKRKTDGK